MPQGNKRKHAQAPGKKSSKHVHQKKGTGGGVQKKGRFIAPKKANVVKLAKLRKNLERAIGSNIEKEVVAMAASREPRPLTVVSRPTPDLKGKTIFKKK
ncbi:leydig cell tumor 10 kDa protein homolog [Asterias amurensis]|uniref:leydig cell tumor 10 kDa protein homolog n=1 Tax=Asterias amurensis TaxID=7602 RepID=UPI003AB613B8